jgi:hypothetical protein
MSVHRSSTGVQKHLFFPFQRLVSIMCHIISIIIDCNLVYFLKFIN